MSILVQLKIVKCKMENMEVLNDLHVTITFSGIL